VTIEKYFPKANPDLLFQCEEFFTNQLRGYTSIEAIIQFAGSLKKKQTKDVDYIVVSDTYPKEKANIWVCWEQRDYLISTFVLDFFFCINSNLDPNTIRSIRKPGIFNFDKKIWHDLKTSDPCVVYTESKNTGKYHSELPQSFVLQVSR
jgi:hypothetical protein